MKKEKKKNDEDRAEEVIKSHEEDVKVIMDFFEGVGIKSVELPIEKQKFIMSVLHYYKFVASDFIGYTPNQKLTNGLTIQLIGKPSPSTPREFTKAYLIFVDSERLLRKPQIGQRVNELTLYITYPLSYVATVERMLKEAKACYCWIGNYSDAALNYTNIHADIHAEY